MCICVHTNAYKYLCQYKDVLKVIVKVRIHASVFPYGRKGVFFVNDSEVGFFVFDIEIEK